MSAVEHGVGLLAGDPLWLFVTRLALLGLAAVLINRIWGRVLRLGGALQVDWVRKFGVRTGGLKLLLWIGVVAYSSAPLFEASLLVSALVFGGGLVIVSIWGFREVQNVIAGTSLAVRAPFALGDEIALGQYRGVVEYTSHPPIYGLVMVLTSRCLAIF